MVVLNQMNKTINIILIKMNIIIRLVDIRLIILQIHRFRNKYQVTLIMILLEYLFISMKVKKLQHFN